MLSGIYCSACQTSEKSYEIILIRQPVESYVAWIRQNGQQVVTSQILKIHKICVPKMHDGHVHTFIIEVSTLYRSSNIPIEKTIISQPTPFYVWLLDIPGPNFMKYAEEQSIS